MAQAGSKRRARAVAQRQASKEQRQKYLVIGAGVLLVLLLAYEVPHTLKLINKSSSSGSPSVAAPLTTPGTASTAPAKLAAATRRALKQPPHDIFTAHVSGGGTTLGSIATPKGLHDPFARGSSGAAAPVVTPTKPRVSTLPGTIVIGTPGPNKVQQQGWIVILASIPTAQGQSAASAFAAQAGKAGVGQVKVLNSSNRKPLRGGYWVVYTGPFSSLTEVSAASTKIQNQGFTNAYIRQLIVYKAKATPAKKTKSKKK